MTPQPIKTIHATAPIRVCDMGGWTDTWFAGYGSVLNIAVSPLVSVQINCFPRTQKEHPVTILARNYGDIYSPRLEGNRWEKHPLIEATIVHMGIPETLAIEVVIHSDAPAGASTGTSAALTIALLAALAELEQRAMTPYELATAAHHIETVLLKQQSGIQDQLCSAFGGINLIEMHSYPHATVTPIQLEDYLLKELEQRLFLVYLGKPHQSSAIHEKVIRELEDLGPTANALQPLRETAVQATNALKRGDIKAFGKYMINNHEAQRQLNSALISPEADQIVALANDYGALGWKVNGAGGNGGSITLLGSSDTRQNHQILQAIESLNPRFKHIPIQIHTTGTVVWVES